MAGHIWTWIFLLIFSSFSTAKRYYATESCGRVYGPEILTIIEFDKDVEYDNKKPADDQNLTPPLKLRNTLWECVIVVKGLPSARVKKYIGIEWRHFHIRDIDINTVEQTVESCGKAYVTIYKGMDASEKITMCGKDARQTFFEWSGNYLTFKFVVDFRRNASYTTPAPPPTPPKTCVEPGDVKGDATTLMPLCTTPKRQRKTTLPPDPYPYPEVYFRADITSFDYACNNSIDKEILKCNDSHRCLDISLMCDNFFSHNCMGPAFPKDNTDQTRDAPAYCNRKPTTTPIPTTTTEAPPKPFPWQPLVAAIGGVLAILLFCWCCWRPGYLPWRLARLRNVPFFNTQRCVCCRGPTKCCKCLPCCADRGEDTFVPVQYKRMNLPKVQGSRLQELQGLNKGGYANGMPRGSIPNDNMANMPPGYMPNGKMQGGYQPNGQMPAGYQPIGNMPGGHSPGGNYPAGYSPSGNYPAGYPPGGNYPSGYFPGGNTGGHTPTGGMPGGYFPHGGMANNGGMPNGGMPYGGMPNGGAAYPNHPKGKKYLLNSGSGMQPYRRPTYVCTYGKDPTNFATDWLHFISGDGAHLREQR